MPSELDTLKAVYNQYLRDREVLLAKAREKEESAESLRKIIREKSGEDPDKLDLASERRRTTSDKEASKPKIPYTPLMSDFVATGPKPQGFRIADVRQYIESRGYKSDRRIMDSAITETCNRMVRKDVLEKHGPLYYLKGEQGQGDGDGPRQVE
jgi:hypothetical protein